MLSTLAIVSVALVSAGVGASIAAVVLEPASVVSEAPSDAGMLNESARWAIATTTRAGASANEGGAVLAVLKRSDEQVNVSADGGPIPVEVLAINWDAREVRGPDLVAGFAERFETTPPAAHARGSLSRVGDAVELLIAPGINVTSIIVFAPETATFLVYAWPSGNAYGYSAGADEWRPFQGGAPAILAREEPPASS